MSTPSRPAPGNGLEGLARLLGRPAVAVLVVLAPMLAVVTYDPPADPDVFARAAVGRLIEVSGGVVDQDPFAFTARKDRWIDHEWLSGVVFYRVARWGGDGALLAFNLLAMVLTVALVAACQRLVDGGRAWSPPWLLATVFPAFGIWISVVRSRVFTFLGLAVMLYCLLRWKKGEGRWLAVIPLIFVPWANAHGGFLAGLGLLGAACFGATLESPRRARALWVCLALAIAATLLNPYGVEYWVYLFEAVTMPRPGIAEWGSLQPGSAMGIVLIGLVAVVALGARTARGRPSAEGAAMLIAAVTAAFMSKRFAYFALLVTAVHGARPARQVASALASRIPDWWNASRHVLTAAVACLTLFATWRTVLHLQRLRDVGLDYAGFPTAAVDWLQSEGSGGRLLVHFNVGSFALWRLYPEYRVSMDGRYEETYPQATVDTVYQALLPDHPAHAAALRAVAPDYILASVTDTDEEPGFGPEWHVVFRDEDFQVLAHDTLPAGSRPARPVRARWAPGF